MTDIESLDVALDRYISEWGPITWECKAPSQSDQVLGRTFSALSTIEADSVVIANKVRVAGMLRDRRISEFVVRWLGEEAEHARALGRMAALYGVPIEPITRGQRRPSLRDMASWPALLVWRAAARNGEATYGALGTAQEFVAMKVYGHLANMVEDEAGGRTLRLMARQEARHMRFYRSVACQFLTTRVARETARIMLRQLWRPPGFDALGSSVWKSIFVPMLEDLRFRENMKSMDRMIDSLPGLAGLRLMEEFISGVCA